MTCGSKSLNSAEKQLYDNRSDDVIAGKKRFKTQKIQNLQCRGKQFRSDDVIFQSKTGFRCQLKLR